MPEACKDSIKQESVPPVLEDKNPPDLINGSEVPKSLEQTGSLPAMKRGKGVWITEKRSCSAKRATKGNMMSLNEMFL